MAWTISGGRHISIGADISNFDDRKVHHSEAPDACLGCLVAEETVGARYRVADYLSTGHGRQYAPGRLHDD